MKKLIILLFFMSISVPAYAVTYVSSRAEAESLAVAGHEGGCLWFGSQSIGDNCWGALRCQDLGEVYAYPAYSCANEDMADRCAATWEANAGIRCDETACIWNLEVFTTGPGSASALGSSADCNESLVVTVNPDNDNVTWSLVGCSAHCEVSGNLITVVSGEAEFVIVSIVFTGPSIDPDDPNHPCNKDTDGDGVKDYLDVSNKYPNNASRYIEVSASDKLADGGSAPSERVYTKYMVLYSDGSAVKTAYLEVGKRPDDFLTNDYNETFCNPNTSKCPEFTAGQLADMYPCDGPDLLVKKSLPAEGRQEIDPSEIKEGGTIPGPGSGIGDNGLLEIIADNTGKTVDNTSVIAKSSMNIEGQLGEINYTLQNGVPIAVVKEKPFDYGDPEPTFDDEFPSDYKSNDIDPYYSDAIESYKNTVDETDLFIQDIEGQFNDNFALNVASPQCSFHLSLLNNSINVNFCPYADHFNYIGLVIRFCVSLNLIIMIVKV